MDTVHIAGATSSQLRDLAELLAGVARGAAAFDRLYMSTRARLYALIYATVRDSGFAEDVMQEVYLEVWQKVHRYRPDMGNPLSWLMMISHRRAIDRVRSEEAQRRKLATMATVFTDIGPNGPDEHVILMDEYRELRTHLAALTERQRHSIELVYFADLSPRHSAHHLNVPLPTFKTRLRDAIQHLRAAHGHTREPSAAA
ncbi:MULTISPECIES: sigma-70 family RNA polymerase sigma factor [Actinomycetes]|uniref:sigma-70 family RNA polymerase sigma factor n=1 Tax=Actinomycetes TaxID=1760 RepID=UPI00068E8945|nr:MULTISPECIES: sigma-70 family RNA polymerase sigma factor [Actinomycetes]